MLISTLNPTSGVYQLVEAVHILAVVVGFGGVLLNGVYAQQGRKRGGAGSGRPRGVKRVRQTTNGESLRW